MTIRESLLDAKQRLLVAWSTERLKNPESELCNALAKLLDDTDKAVKLADERAVEEEKKEVDWQAELDNLIRNSRSVNFVDAIKFHRSKTGDGLRESMYYVQRRAAELKGK